MPRPGKPISEEQQQLVQGQREGQGHGRAADQVPPSGQLEGWCSHVFSPRKAGSLRGVGSACHPRPTSADSRVSVCVCVGRGKGAELLFQAPPFQAAPVFAIHVLAAPVPATPHAVGLHRSSVPDHTEHHARAPCPLPGAAVLGSRPSQSPHGISQGLV